MRRKKDDCIFVLISLLTVISLLFTPSLFGSEPQLQVGEAKIIYGSGASASGRWRPSWSLQLLALKDGSLVLGDSGYSLWSSDRGNSWFTGVPLPSQHVLQLRNGSFYALEHETKPKNGEGLFIGRKLEVSKLQKQVSELVEKRWSDVPVTVKRWTDLHGDDGSRVGTFRFGSPMLELEDGTLLMGKAGNFKGDLESMQGFVPTKGEKWFKYRTYLLKSGDRGKSWNYFSTVAYDGVSGQESFCEPAIVDLDNGELLCVMRTGRYAPMYQTRSFDNGKTWQTPQPLKTLGLSPMMVLLPNGVLVSSFGWRPFKDLPSMAGGGAYGVALEDYKKRFQNWVGIEDPSGDAGDYVMISRDKGNTWSQPTKIAEPLTAGYTLLAVTGVDSVLVLSRRIVIEGQSRKDVLQKWESEGEKGWNKKSGVVIEARKITVRP